MTDIFLSYSWQDKDRARAIRDALRSAGYSVWWDEDLNPEEKVTQEILDAHDASTRVLVLWSFASVESDWVTGEAERAKRHKKLIQAFLDDLDLLEYHPQFNNFHGLDLVNWEDGKDETEWPRLLRHLGRVIGPGRLAPGAPEPAEPAHHPDPDDGPVLFPMSSRILLPLLGLAAVMVPLLWQVTLDWGWLLPIAVILAPCLIVLVWTFFSYRPPLQRGDRGGDRAGNRRLRNIVSGQAGWERRYIRWLNDGLHGFSRWIGEPQVTGTPDEALPRAWTGTSLFFCLGLAIAYPLLFLLIGWALGGSGALGGFELLSADTPCVRRAGVFGFIFTVAVSVWIERRLAARGREVVGYILLVLGLCVSLVPLSYAIVNSGVVVGVGFGVGVGGGVGVVVGVRGVGGGGGAGGVKGDEGEGNVGWGGGV
ncbi:MAG: toll/interleukin-1 receptor domain-containing protein, partial [Alphaproteobacteria bacterium]